MAKIEKIGSLYFDGRPQKVGVAYNGEQISFGDAAPGQEISWVRMQSGLLVADRCVCTNISWEDLDKEGFVFGALVTINGETYLCRCLKVGAKEGETNEWDAALDETGEGDDLWHWENKYFWGQETSKHGASTRAVRGYYSARHWINSGNTATRLAHLGFRPVLEPLLSGGPEVLVGRNIKVFGPREEYIRGRLVEFSDYDLMVDPAAGIGDGIGWTRRHNGMVIIERSAITKIWEA